MLVQHTKWAHTYIFIREVLLSKTTHIEQQNEYYLSKVSLKPTLIANHAKNKGVNAT
jgi:hypothetical protein